MKRMFYSLIIAALVSTLAMGAEVRKLTQEDIEWGDPATTVTSAGGHVGHRIDNTFKLSAPYVDVRAYGAVGDGVTDDTAAIQAAIATVDSAGLAQAPIFFPPGVYLVTDTLTVSVHRTHIIGAGPHNTQIKFNPATAKSCFEFTAGASMLVQTSIKNLAFTSSNSVQKTAIKAIDVDLFTVEDVAVYLDFVGNVSTGLHFRGRDAITVNRFVAVTDRPIYIETNPNSAAISLDFASFSNIYLTVTDNTQSAITIATGSHITNLSFDTLSVAQGKYMFLWNDTTSTGNSLNVRFRNVRWEQTTASDGWMYYVKVAGTLRQLIIDDSFGAAHQTLSETPNGIYLNNVSGATIRDTTIVDSAAKNAYEIDNNCRAITMSNIFYATVTPNKVVGSFLKAKMELLKDDGGTMFVYYEPWDLSSNMRAVKINGNSYSGTSFALPTATATTWYRPTIKSGRASITAVSQSDNTIVGGTILMGESSKPWVLLDNTANFVISNTAGNFCVLQSGYNLVFYSYLAPTFDVVVELISYE